MERTYIKLIFVFMVIAVHGKSFSKSSSKCQQSRMPLISNIKAPLIAELDVTSMNEQLETYIIETIKSTFSEDMKDMVQKEQEDLKSSMLQYFLSKLNNTQKKFDEEVSRIIQNLEARYGEMQEKMSDFYRELNATEENCETKIKDVSSRLEQRLKSFKVTMLSEYSSKLQTVKATNHKQITDLANDIKSHFFNLSQYIQEDKVNAPLQQKLDLLDMKLSDLDTKLADIEMKNNIALNETVNKNGTSVDTHTTCYNDGVWQKYNESNICVCTAGFLGKQCEYSDGKDTSFMVIFHEGYSYLPSWPQILVASSNTANLSIRYFNNTANQTFIIDKGHTEYNLSNSVVPSDGIYLAGVEVHADVKINLYGFRYRMQVSEGFLAMPLKFASTKYIIPSFSAYAVYYGYKNYLALSPIFQNTAVSIHLKLEGGYIIYESKRYYDNDTIKVVINKYNTFQISRFVDLSGTLVTSPKPVIVVSGSQCNLAVPEEISLGSCQPFIESILPTDQLDNMFIMPHISTRLNNTVRIQAVNSTNLTIKIGDKTISKTLNARDFFDFYYSTISFISSSDDILVMSYPHGLSERNGDPFMMTIPGVNQYLYEHDFVVPKGFDSFISITVRSDAVDGFFLDGNSSNSRSRVFSISEGINNFSTFSLPISTGLHHIEHKKTVRFGLWIYGNKHGWDGYGYPAGMAYKTYH